MSRPDRSVARAIVVAGLSFASFAATGSAQANMAPINSAPNPYTTVEGWAKLPEGRTWGSTSAVDIDRDGKSIWVAERCGTNNCAGSMLDPVLKFDANGTLVAHFGAGLILSPHAITVDKDNNVWVVDCACTLGGGRGRGGAGRGADSAAGRAAAPPAPPVDATPKGHQIYKFSSDGKLLMTLGKAGGARDPEFFFQPNDVLVAPNGDIFVSEGHSSSAGSTARVLKFSKDGKLIKTWGSWARAPMTSISRTRSRWTRGAACLSAIGATTGSRSSTRMASCSTRGISSVVRAGSSSMRRTTCTWRIQSRVPCRAPRTRLEARHSHWQREGWFGEIFIPDPAEKATEHEFRRGCRGRRGGHIYGAEVGPRCMAQPRRRTSNDT